MAQKDNDASANTSNIAQHKQLAEAAFEQQRHDKVFAKAESDVHYITFDPEKTLPLPKLSVSAAFYLSSPLSCVAVVLTAAL